MNSHRSAAPFDFLPKSTTEMTERIAGHDWPASPLGALQSWPPELKIPVSIMLSSRHPMCLAWGAEQTFIYNDAYAPFLGARHPGALGQPFAHVWSEIWNDIGPLVARALSGESVWLEDMYLRMTRNGYPEDTWWTFCYSPLLADGAVKGMLNVCTDSTGKVLTEQARRRAEARQHFLLKLSDALRPLSDPRDIQETAARLLGVELNVSRALYACVDEERGVSRYTIERNYLGSSTMAPVIGKFPSGDFGSFLVEESLAGRTTSVSDIGHDHRLTDHERAAYRSLDIGAYVSTPLLKGGKWVALVSIHSATPRDWNSAELTLVEDVAERTWAAVERARSDQALLESESALRTTDRRKDEFLAMLAHELRNPLAPIRNGARILQEGADPDRIASVSAMVQRQVAQMVRLVDDLLDVSRVSQGKIELKQERCDLEAVIRQAIEANRPACDRLGHQVTLTLPARPLRSWGDAARLAQVVGNLIHNACKFTPRGGQIAVSVSREGERAVIRVRDSGIGMSAEQIRYVFDLFAQADTSLERTEGGLGIGLTLARRLVEMHGGSLAAASAGIGAGSEFVVRLPALPDETATAALATADTGPATVPRRILVVDDNLDAAQTLAMLLESDGHQIMVAHDGRAAVELATGAFDPQAVLLDIGLPGMSGYEAARAIRAGRSTPITLIALTGWGQAADKSRSRDAGFDAHLVKPVDYDMVRSLLNHLAAV